jgi:cell wall assembly regulator SMI1
MDQATITLLWQRLETWLGIHAPDILTDLQPGATEAEIQQTEAILGVQFPEDFKAVYRCHNGQGNAGDWLLDGREFLSLERIQEEWQVWKELLDCGDFDDSIGEPTKGIRTDWWHAKWIPVTYDGAGNHDCLDLAPAEGGTMGQIIEFWHDDPYRKVLAESYGTWFTAFVLACESGQYVYSEEYGGIVDRDDL